MTALSGRNIVGNHNNIETTRIIPRRPSLKRRPAATVRSRPCGDPTAPTPNQHGQLGGLSAGHPPGPDAPFRFGPSKTNYTSVPAGARQKKSGSANVEAETVIIVLGWVLL